MKRLSIFALIIILASCSGTNTQEKESAKETAQESTEETLKFKSRGIQTIYDAYEDLRDAFVATDFESAKKYAEALKAAFESEQKVNEAGMVGAIIDAEEIEAAREAFFQLNENLEELLSSSIESGKVHKCFCPMARNNQGGSWFSTEAEILNPYYGDKMLKCGTIKKTLE